MKSVLKLAVAMLCVAPLLASAEAPLIVFDERVAQYKSAAAGARRQLSGATEVNPSSGDLAAKMAEASVVVAIGQAAFSAAQKAAPDKPVVYCLVLGVNLSGSAANVTGVPMETDPRVMFAHIKTLSPRVKRVGLLYNSQTGEAFVREARAAAEAAGVTLVSAGVNGPNQVKAILTAKAGGMDAVWLPPDPKLFTREIFTWVLSFTSERKLPLYGFLDSYTQAGALASVSPDYEDIGARAGRLAADIAARSAGERVPVPSPVYSPGKLTINLQTAHALGIDVPQNAVSQARQVYR